MPPRVISYDDALHAGRRMFAERATIDMDALAEDLAVSRATLYRVVSTRDHLLGDVLWSFAVAMYGRARDEAQGEGAERVLDVLRRFGEQIMDNRWFREFLAAEPQVAVRVLFTPSGGVHERFVAANTSLILDTAADSGMSLPFDIDTLAYVFSRIFESMWYADLLSDREPDLDIADRAARAVLLSENPAGASGPR